ncbi:MAG: hypothetical protein ACKVX9_08970 [Blastocatellia bacterium]
MKWMYIRQHKWVLLIAILLAVAFTIKLYRGGTMSGARERRQIEKLFGINLPKHFNDLHYFKWQPNADLSYYVTYIKLRASQEEFAVLAAQMGLTFTGGGGDADLHLPAAWEPMPEVRLEWWDSTPATPSASAARSFGANGWIVAKYERDCVYLIVTDTGYSEGKPSSR